MAIRKRFNNPFAHNVSAEQQAASDVPDVEAPAYSKGPLDKSHETGDEIVDEKAQGGTQKAQASTQAWTRNTLIAAYIL